MFIYVFVLAGIRREFLRYRKLSYRLGLPQFTFVKKIHAMSFVFDFSHEIRFFVYQVKSTRKFFHALKSFPNFAFVCCHYKIT